MFRLPTTINFLRKIITPIHKFHLRMVPMINSHLNLPLLLLYPLHLILCIILLHHINHPVLVLLKNLNEVLKSVIPVFFQIIPMHGEAKSWMLLSNSGSWSSPSELNRSWQVPKLLDRNFPKTRKGFHWLMLIPVVIKARNNVHVTKDITIVRIHKGRISDELVMSLVTNSFARVISLYEINWSQRDPGRRIS